MRRAASFLIISLSAAFFPPSIHAELSLDDLQGCVREVNGELIPYPCGMAHSRSVTPQERKAVEARVWGSFNRPENRTGNAAAFPEERTGNTAGFPEGKREREGEYTRLAQESFENGDFERARSYAREAAAKDPQDAKAAALLKLTDNRGKLSHLDSRSMRDADAFRRAKPYERHDAAARAAHEEIGRTDPVRNYAADFVGGNRERADAVAIGQADAPTFAFSRPLGSPRAESAEYRDAPSRQPRRADAARYSKVWTKDFAPSRARMPDSRGSVRSAFARPLSKVAVPQEALRDTVREPARAMPAARRDASVLAGLLARLRSARVEIASSLKRLGLLPGVFGSLGGAAEEPSMDVSPDLYASESGAVLPQARRPRPSRGAPYGLLLLAAGISGFAAAFVYRRVRRVNPA
ncbi:MAG: hypothetical protein HY078_10835 [Elusimicrobia bacterium]|nr:hypothetical protein [Elusimicrobiota bacterium]